MKLIKNCRPGFKNKNVLIIGGSGFIGSHLIEELINYKPRKIIIIDNLSVGQYKNISQFSKQIKFIKKDAENFIFLRTFFNNKKIDYVFNLATMALPFSVNYPRKTFETNVTVILNLLELLRLKKYKTLCHFSSSEVYGSAINIPMNEQHPLNPTTTYAGGKLAADFALKTYCSMFKLDAFIVRPFNNYGPKQLISRKEIGVIPATIKRIINKKSPIIHGHGNQKRDFIYVKNTTKYILEIFRKVKSGSEINITNQNVIKIKNLIKDISKIMKSKKKIKFSNERVADVMCHHGDNRKLKQLVKLKSENYLGNLKKTIKFYLD